MAKAARISLMALVGVVLLLLAAMLLLESPWARGWLEGQVSQRLNGREVEIGGLDIGWGWPLTVRVEDVRIANPDWAEHEQMLELAALEIGMNPGALLRGQVDLRRLHLERPVIHLARRQDGTTNWADLLGGSTQDDTGGGGIGIRPDIVSVDQGHLTYRDAVMKADIAADFATRSQDDGPRQVSLEVSGEYRGAPLQLSGLSGAPERALTEGATYPVTLDGRLGEVRARFDGQIRDVMQLAGLEGQLEVSAPDDADVATLAGRAGLDLPALDVRGQLRYQDNRWALEEFTARLGEEQVSGSLAMTLGETPRFEARLRAEHLALERWGVTQFRRPEERQEAEQVIEQEIEQVAWDRRWAERLAPLRQFDAEVDLAVDRLSYGDVTLRDVALVGQLEAGRLDVQRLHVAQGEGELTTQGWLEVRPETLEGDIDTRASQVDLGEALAPLGYPELGQLDGRVRVRVSGATLAFDDTSFDYRAPAQSLALHVNAETAAIEGDSAPGVHLQGDGTYRERPFAYDLTVGPLLDLDDPDKPYPVQGVITSEETRLRVDGTIKQPLQIAAVQGTFQLSGPNPAELNRLTGLNLPALPPYDVAGELQVADDLVRLRDLQGRFGNSDVSGDVRLRLGERNMLWATLHSQRLDLDDLAPLTGAAPDTGSGEQASPEQRQAAQAEAANPGVFPDREWNLEGLRRMDAEVRYDAASVSAKNVPLNDVALDLRIDHGVLTLTPLRFGLGGGEVVSRVTMDAQGDSLQGDLELSLSQVNLKTLLQRADLPQIAEDSAGVIGGQGQMRFHGNSLDESMANLDGVLELAMSGGMLDAVVLEAVGLDVSEALLAALVDSDQVPMSCAYLQLDATDGTAALEQFFIDTEDSNLTGGGTIDLDAERVELVFEAHPKDPSLPASDSPVKLQGPMSDLGVNVISRELVARGVLSVLGALVAPPLAILPWIETGTGENVGPGCRQIVEGEPDEAQG